MIAIIIHYVNQAYLRVFCTRNPAIIPMVVGKDAAHTPSRFNVLSSIFSATTRGGAHYQNKEYLIKNSYSTNTSLRYFLLQCGSKCRHFSVFGVILIYSTTMIKLAKGHRLNVGMTLPRCCLDVG